MSWNAMTERQRFYTLKTMEQTGGGFASHLASAWQRADGGNSMALARAFPDLIDRYGPESDLYVDKEDL